MAQLASSTERTEPVVAAMANPAPLGLSAFALTTLILSAWNAQIFSDVAILIGPALFYGGLVQLLAGMWEFRAGNTFGATAFSSYGGFWLAFGAILLFHIQFSDTSLGFFRLGWTIFTGIMLLGTLRANLALLGVFLFLFLTFLALTIGAFGGGSTFNIIGGWLGIITAIIAWYTAAAGILTSVKSSFLLPTWPLS
jgi:uncharacterized protein